MTYTIGELAKQASVNIQTIRFYERKGILRPLARTDAGYRLYNENHLSDLRFVIHAKELGFSLKEIKELLILRSPSSERCASARQKASEKLSEVRSKIRQLKQIESVLKGLIKECEAQPNPDECPIITNMEGN